MLINRLYNYNINEEVERSNKSEVNKVIIEVNSMSFVAKSKELEELDNLCFVLGYN